MSGVVAPVEESVLFEGRRGMVLRADTGENPWTHARYGELDGMPVVAAVAAGVAGLLRSELGGHGHLRSGALDLLYGGGVQILPPFVLASWFAEQDGTPQTKGPGERVGHEGRSVASRDLLDVAALMGWLIGGVSLTAGDASSLAKGLAEYASPGTVQHVRVLVDLAATDPSAEVAAAALDRLARRGAGRAAATVAAADRGGRASSERRSSERRPSENRLAERAAGSDPSGGAEKPPRARVRRGSGAGTALVGFLMLLIGAWVIDGGETVRRLIGALMSGGATSLEGPSDPMKNAGSGDSYPQMTADDYSDAHKAKPDIEETIEGLTPAESAQKILADMAAARAAKNPPPVIPKSSYDRAKLDEGDRLRKEGEEVIRQVIEREIPFSERNVNLDRAIKLLEDAREGFIGFQDEFPGKADLVEGALEDINSLLRLAYKSKTH